MLPLGKLAVNLTNCPRHHAMGGAVHTPSGHYAHLVHQLVQSVLPASTILTVNIPALNGKRPRKRSLRMNSTNTG